MILPAPRCRATWIARTPRYAGGAVDQHCLAGTQLGPFDQRRPRRDARDCHRCRGGVVDAVGQWEKMVVVDEAELGHRAEGCFRHEEIDARSVGGDAGPVDPRHEGEGALAAVVGARGAAPRHVADGRCGHPDEALAGRRFGVIEIAIDRRLACFDYNGCFHLHLPQAIPPREFGRLARYVYYTQIWQVGNP